MIDSIVTMTKVPRPGRGRLIRGIEELVEEDTKRFRVLERPRLLKPPRRRVV